MASGVTDFGAATWLAALFGISGAVTSYWVALCSDEPGVDVDGDALADLEPQDPAYARQQYQAGAAGWGIDGLYVASLLDIDFGQPSVDWGPINHFALCTAATGGDVYAYGQFLNPTSVAISDSVYIPAGGVALNLSALENSIAL